MPIALLFIGAVFIVAAIRGTHKDLFEILKDDFGGSNNFLVWGMGIFFIGAIGYAKSLKPISNAFLVLLFVVIFLTSGQGFWTQFQSQIRN